jgi:streptomycin 3"-adenylyltransferase
MLLGEQAADGPLWWSQAQAIVDTLGQELGGDLTGVYVHGAAALGGWVPTSDLDMLVVVADSAERDWLMVGSRLLAAATVEQDMEMSVVTANASRRPGPPWPFLLHVASGEHRVVLDAGHGDPDLLMHYLVTRRAGLTLIGEAAERTFGEVPNEVVRQYLVQELGWGLEHADAKYAVLNACRALAYAVDGRILSKVDGGLWALNRGLDDRVIGRALVAQREGLLLGPAEAVDRNFVEGALLTIRKPDATVS